MKKTSPPRRPEPTEKLTLSVLVPVYNEEHLVAASLRRLELLAASPHLSRVEVIVVDDASRDRTPEVLAAFEREAKDSKLHWIFLRHERNGGKGKAVQTALARAQGDVSVIHDADLEYHPKDLLRIVAVFAEEEADAVFGSRFTGEVRRALLFRHQIANKALTLACNLVSDLNLTDMETCYKAVRTPLLKSIPLVSNDFRIEPELTIKLAKRGARVFEVPISYAGRTYQEGKKIGWRDGVRALAAIARFGLSDEIYTADRYGSQTLSRLSRAERFNEWMADTIRPYCGERVLEIGSGVGNLTRRLVPRKSYVASDVNPHYLAALQSLTATRPYLEAVHCDLTDPRSFQPLAGRFDTVICLNVLEHVKDDRGALENLWSALAPGGRAVLLVPNGQWNFGTLDEALGHERRYSPEALGALAREVGFEVEKLLVFNRIGSPAWFLNGRLLRRRHFGLVQVWALNALTPLFRQIDARLPFPPLSVIGVLRRPAKGTHLRVA